MLTATREYLGFSKGKYPANHLLYNSFSFTCSPRLDFGDWRFNLRASNTEPLIRLNIETRGDKDLLKTKINEIEDWLAQQGAVPA